MPEPLSIASGDAPHPLDNHEDQDDSNDNEPPLDQRILETVKGCPKDDAQQYLVRPARLSAELGLSIEDATAELCGLLAAVGGGHDGASFKFETTTSKDPTTGATTGQVATMLFTFPHDFATRAKRNRQKEDFRQYCWQSLHVVWKGIKIVTAFGLILSLCILVIAAMIGIVVAIVAMSTNNQRGNGHHRTLLFRQLHSLFFTVRQLLWCYVLFGQNVEGQDPLLGEMAHDTALLMSVCCGNPGSFFWWYRVQQLQRRRHFRRRGWGGRGGLATTGNELESDIAGVQLLRRGEWGQEEQQSQLLQSSSLDEQRGLLSIAVEYLFGPSPFQPGPFEAEKWKLRAAAIVELSSKDGNGVSLQQLSPYSDEPPSSLDQDVPTLVAGGLRIVSHFNGVPVVDDKGSSDGEEYLAMKPHIARFTFPELLGESQHASPFDNSRLNQDDAQDESWRSLLCVSTTAHAIVRTTLRTGTNTFSVPTHLTERRYKFTKLQSNQFFYCVSLGALNLIGVIWLRQSLEPPNGMLQISDGTLLATLIKKSMMPVLYFYGILFFVLPGARLMLITFLNWRIKKRNERRKGLAASMAS
jgi:hypothetical protein